MKLGAEPKKLAILVGLLLVAAYFLYSNLQTSPDVSAARPARAGETHSALPVPATLPETKTAAPQRHTEQEFKLSFKVKGVDPISIDPKLRLDLLTKVRSVDVGPASRNLFAYGAAPPPPLPPGAKVPEKIIPKNPTGPNSENASAGPPQPPPPPPITLKYYGYTATHPDGHKRAFFSEGDCSGNMPSAQCDIFVAAEGELILKRYKVLHIGASSVEMEDTQFNHKQPLPITQESPG